MPTSPLRDQLEAFLLPYRKDLRRKERFWWALVYLEGLLHTPERKTIEGIARSIAPPPEVRGEDVRQALQNFIQESPWDEQRLLRRYRQALSRHRSDGLLVVEDISLPKQGRHSVGVQRQHCADLGKKLNCQVVPAVFLVTEELVAPLAMRLYLPHAWQKDAARLDAARVPPAERTAASKSQLALDLLSQLATERLPYRRLAAAESYARSAAFRDGPRPLGLRLHEPADEPLARVHDEVRTLKDRFGLDHFEGRTWRGLHHHLCLLTLAHGFTLEPSLSQAQPQVSGV